MRAVRASWRWLTSMRTALVLLLLLAVAAVPGSVFPQRNVSPERVRTYLATHGGTGALLDRFGFFDVYASPWFSAVYLLLMVSLVGCLVPRLRQHAANLLTPPPDAPARLDRLPHSVSDVDSPAGPAETAEALRRALRAERWRVVVRHSDGDAGGGGAAGADGAAVTVAAEKGLLKETGNLIFHFALLAVLVGVALGSWYGWHANRLVVAGDDFGFCDTLPQYDEYRLGPRMSATELPPFCVTLNDFHADYLDNGQPVKYSADISYIEGVGAATKAKRLEVNDPLRLGGTSVYLISHGYAPVVRYTDRYGVTQTTVAAFLPTDGMLTSTGVIEFPDANVDPSGVRPRDVTTQVAFRGVYLPTMPDQATGALSAYPAERKPALFLTAYQGDLGLGIGMPTSVYELNQHQLDTGRLRQVAVNKAMKPGDAWTLPDGSRVEFLGTRPWIGVSVRHDPGQPVVLGGAAAILVGLTMSLLGRRRRVWARVTPAGGGRSLVSLGGLARGEHLGFAAEFARVVGLLGAPDEAARPVVAAERGH
jgi:cytochrome c biogenesis protein